MRVLVSGSNGMIGEALANHLRSEGHDVVCLVRAARPGEGEVSWDPKAGVLDATELEGLDGVVHLAGDPIAQGRWTADKMRRIRDSRVDGTRLLSEAIAGLEAKPSVMICASAIGFYGDRGDDALNEASSAGSGFLAETCEEWERATDPAGQAGVRVVNLRIGIVLSTKGGALSKMLTPFRFGLGGRIGDGRQWMSWIELDDLVRTIEHGLVTESLEGPVNAVSPRPATNSEYTKVLGRVLSRPAVLPVPALGARIAFGRMADDLLLASTRVEPRALESSGFEFRHPDLEGALRHALGRNGSAK